MPQLMPWAWEEPQDLRFLKGHEAGVAFFAEHLRLRGAGVDIRRRQTPLLVDQATPLMAVVRIDGDTAERPALDEGQVGAAMRELEGVLALPSVQAIQLDFDARNHERAFYSRLLSVLRSTQGVHPLTPGWYLLSIHSVSWNGQTESSPGFRNPGPHGLPDHIHLDQCLGCRHLRLNKN